MNNYKNYFVVHDQEVVEPELLSFGVDQYYTIFQCFFFLTMYMNLHVGNTLDQLSFVKWEKFKLYLLTIEFVKNAL